MSDWYLRDPAGAATGPFATQAIVQWIGAGQVGPQHGVCAVGAQKWVGITEVPVFQGAFAARAGGLAATGAQQARPAPSQQMGAPPASLTPAPHSPAPSVPPAAGPGPVMAGAASGPADRVSAPPSEIGLKPMGDLGKATMAIPSLMEAPEMAAILAKAGINVGPKGGGGIKNRTMLGQMAFGPESMATRRMAIIGRAEGSDILLPYPQVSTRHTGVAPTADGMLTVTDLGSTNGTHVDGKRIPPNTPVKIKPGDKIFVGPYAIFLGVENNEVRAWVDSDRADWSGNLIELEALDLFLQVQDREDKAKNKVLLNHVTFKAHPGDLIALMGPSGAGKTTLLTVLNGYLHPTSGEVRVNGESLYAIYDALRGSIGYVPQDDIVHSELTVFEAIKYSAMFRLPADFAEEEVNRRVEQVIKDLGLEQVKNLEIGKPERKVLSGGQRKRVNIALELVTDPALMFLDEPTSGLAADDTVALIDLLAGLAKKYGKTIIVTIHQPAREEYEKFNLALVMGFGGEPVYYGPTGKESYDFFGRYVAQKGGAIDNPRDMFDLLKKREEEAVASGRYPDKPAARSAAAQQWRSEYYNEQNPTWRKMYTGARQPGKPSATRAPSRARVPLFRQFWLLFKRYATVKKRDRAGTAILLAQAPIIGVLLAVVFSDPAKMPNLWCQQFVQAQESDKLKAGVQMLPTCLQDYSRFPKVADFSSAVFFLTVAALWFGTSNAAREIVSEQAIYRRERMVNLSIFNYVMSKFTLLALLCSLQCTVLLGIVYPGLGLGDGSPATALVMLAYMIVTAISAAAIGLLLSAVVTSSEAAMALTPIALIPQVVLGGRIVPMTNKSWLQYIMAAIPSRWSFEGLVAAERYKVSESWKIKTCIEKGTGIVNSKFNCALEEVRNVTKGGGGLGFSTYDQPAVSLAVLGGMTAVCMIAIMIILRRRDSV